MILSTYGKRHLLIDYTFEDIIIRSYPPEEIWRIQGECDASIAHSYINQDYESYRVFREYFDASFSLSDQRQYTRWFTSIDHPY